MHGSDSLTSMPLDLERSTLAFADVTTGNSGARQLVLHIFLTPS